jgi:SAM-dependent methyltransferase
MRHDAFTPNQWFDKFLTFCRYRRVYQVLEHSQDIKTIYDLGCGSGNLVKALREKGYEAFGVDVKSGQNILAADLNKPLPIESNTVDFVTSLANIEHLHDPLLNLKEIHRVLKTQGTLVLTTPSTAAKPVLECLAFKLKLIDPMEILDHKMYFSKALLESYLSQAGFKQFWIKRFQCGMNLHAVAIK